MINNEIIGVLISGGITPSVTLSRGDKAALRGRLTMIKNGSGDSSVGVTSP